MRRQNYIVLAGVLGATRLACGSSGAATESETAFWNAFHAGDLTAGSASADALKASYDANPKNFRTTLMLGMNDLWLAAESGRDPATRGQNEQKYAPTAARYVAEAHGLDPSDAFTTAFLGYMSVDQGTQMGDQQTVMQGKALIDQAYQAQPELGWFLELLEAQFVAPNDPQMQKAIDSSWKFFEVCGGAIDHTHPDFAAYFSRLEAQGTRAFCTNDDLAPHAMEGILLYLGDLHVKAGNVDLAKLIYAGAKSSKSYAGWPHSDVIDARLSSDLAARSRAYQQPGPGPIFGDPPYSCTTCHGLTAK